VLAGKPRCATISYSTTSGRPRCPRLNAYYFAAEVCDLRWDQIDFNGAVLHVRRVKNGTPSTHPIQGDELRALRRLQRESPSSPFIFVSERGSPFTTAGFARMIERAAAGAGHSRRPRPFLCSSDCDRLADARAAALTE
jgi:integrase